MKAIILSLLVFTITFHQAQAQDPVKANHEHLKSLDYFAGRWKGEAVVQRRNAPPMKVSQEERIEWRLDSLVLTMEGTGRDPVTQKQLFHALGVIAYNQQTQKLGMKSFTHDGRQIEAYFTLLQENKFEWGFDLQDGKAKIRYTITLSPQAKTWYEKGEYSPDGSNWFPTIELNLVKQ